VFLEQPRERIQKTTFTLRLLSRDSRGRDSYDDVL